MTSQIAHYPPDSVQLSDSLLPPFKAGFTGIAISSRSLKISRHWNGKIPILPMTG